MTPLPYSLTMLLEPYSEEEIEDFLETDRFTELAYEVVKSCLEVERLWRVADE